MREYGYLFLLIASSETRGRRLLQGCQHALVAESRALVAHRYCTRAAAEAYEVALSEAEFAARNDFGCFLLDWQQKELRFGLGVEVDRWLDGGLNVVALGSAQLIEAARRRYRHHLRVVYAPGGKDPRAWLERVLENKRIGFRQLGLGLDGAEQWTGPIDGLQLDEDMGLAIRQLSAWVQSPTPPAQVAA